MIIRTKIFVTGLFVFSLQIGVFFTSDNNFARADDPDFLSVGIGWFDFNREKDVGGEFRLEYRSDKKWWVFNHLQLLR